MKAVRAFLIIFKISFPPMISNFPKCISKVTDNLQIWTHVYILNLRTTSQQTLWEECWHESPRASCGLGCWNLTETLNPHIRLGQEEHRDESHPRSLGHSRSLGLRGLAWEVMICNRLCCPWFFVLCCFVLGCFVIQKHSSPSWL